MRLRFNCYFNPILIFIFLPVIVFAQSNIETDLGKKVIDPYINHLNNLLANNSDVNDKENLLHLFENNRAKVSRDFIGNNAGLDDVLTIAAYIDLFKYTWQYDDNVEDEVAVTINPNLIYYCKQKDYHLVYIKKSISGRPMIRKERADYMDITEWIKITVSDVFKIVSIENAAQPIDKDKDHVIDACDECQDNLESRDNVGPWHYNGCPDGDEDGWYDAIDCCPKHPGNKPNLKGCPDGDDDNVPDIESRCFDNIADKCPGIKGGTSYCQGCNDTDGDGVCDWQEKCPNEKGSRKNGCPPEKPPALFSIAIAGGYVTPLDRFGDYAQALDDDTGTWTNGSGFASPNFGASISVDWTPLRFCGIGLTASWSKLPFRQEDLERQIKIFLAKNQVNYREVVLSASNDSYSGLYTGLKTMVGFFNDPWGIRLEPTAGWMLTNFYKNSISSRIDLVDQPVETRALSLVADNFFAWGGNLILTKSIERKWGISVYASLLQGQYNALPGQLDFAGQTSVLSFTSIRYKTLGLGLEIAYYLK